jgi:hypothetical protein
MSESSDTDSLDRPEMAFEAMSAKLAGLTAAIDGFAARQQELHARDYGPDLAKIHERQSAFRTAILTLNERPAMALTPEQVAEQIVVAGNAGRSADHHAWANAQRELGQSIQSITAVVASAKTAQKQKQWLAGGAAAAMVVGFVLGATLPDKIDHAVPESWYWPEERAATVLQRNGWDAGIRLLQVSDPKRLQAVTAAIRLASDNAAVLAECEAHRAKAKHSACTLEVSDATAS